jgi:hypothetical protein
MTLKAWKERQDLVRTALTRRAHYAGIRITQGRALSRDTLRRGDGLILEACLTVGDEIAMGYPGLQRFAYLFEIFSERSMVEGNRWLGGPELSDGATGAAPASLWDCIHPTNSGHWLIAEECAARHP